MLELLTHPTSVTAILTGLFDCLAEFEKAEQAIGSCTTSLLSLVLP